MTTCFTYGSLMCPDIMTFAAGRPLAGEPARLTGYRRLAVAGEDYPGIVEADDRVEGVLYRGLDTRAWALLDAFEGEMYARLPVTVTLPSGSAEPAWTYVFKPEFRHLLRPEPWDFEAFLRQGKARFEARYVGFRR